MKQNNIEEFLNNNKGLLLVILLAFILRMFFFISLSPWKNEVVNNTIMVTDAPEYHRLALSLLNKRSFENFDGFRTPGYPTFLALLYSISSNSVWFVLLVQVFLNLISVFLVYKIALFIFSKDIALLSAFLFSINLNQIIYSLSLLSDILFVLLFLVSIYYLLKGFKLSNFTSYFISAFFLGVATLVRPISSMFPLLAVVFMFFLSNLKLKMKLSYSLLFIITFIATISPWLIHNYSKYGEPNLTSIVGYNLLFYNVASTESFKTGKKIEQVRAEYDNMAIKEGADTSIVGRRYFKDSRIYSKIAVNYIENNLALYLKRNIVGIIYMYCASPVNLISDYLHIKIKSYDTTNKFSSGFNPILMIRSMNIVGVVILFFASLYLIINYIFSFVGILYYAKKRTLYILFVLFCIFL